MNDKVLDAGCGVGGAAFFINKMKNAEVTGISLSEKQINYASKFAAENNVADRVSFQYNGFYAYILP